VSAVVDARGFGAAAPDPAPPAGGGGTPDPAPAPARGPRFRRWWPWAVAAAVTAVAVAGAGFGAQSLARDPAEAPALGPGKATVEIAIDHSLFADRPLRVIEGTRVRFVIVNRDPIGHEFIVGPPAVHARHAAGHEATHRSVPGEVSVDPNATAITTYRFDRPGTVVYACHLPGHYEYGMHGVIEVVPA
jgi:uncharacterized cupredoxin-like copper-binding protein